MRLPSYIGFFEAKAAQHDQEIASLSQQVAVLSDLVKTRKSLEAAYHRLDKRVLDISHRLEAATILNTATKDVAVVNKTVSDNHAFDQFYKSFEDEFRGSEEVIQKRLEEYLPRFEKLPKTLRKKPIVDIGCGRGEMLSLLKQHGLYGVGIDMNKSMVKRATDAGHEAYATDALSYLRTKEEGSLAAITGFHIVEHIPFEALMEIFEACYRTLENGGFVLFETPNPETLSVGSHSFYLDPSHLRPVPPGLLAFMLEYVGFECEIVRLHPIDVLPKSVASRHLRKIYTSIFGPADYAVVGTKI